MSAGVLVCDFRVQSCRHCPRRCGLRVLVTGIFLSSKNWWRVKRMRQSHKTDALEPRGAAGRFGGCLECASSWCRRLADPVTWRHSLMRLPVLHHNTLNQERAVDLSSLSVSGPVCNDGVSGQFRSLVAHVHLKLLYRLGTPRLSAAVENTQRAQQKLGSGEPHKNQPQDPDRPSRRKSVKFFEKLA